MEYMFLTDSKFTITLTFGKKTHVAIVIALRTIRGIFPWKGLSDVWYIFFSSKDKYLEPMKIKFTIE